MNFEFIDAGIPITCSCIKTTRKTINEDHVNWNYVYRRKPSQGAVTFDVYGGAALLKSCPTEILNKDFSDTSSSSDSAECDLPADSYAKIDRIVFRIKGSYR